MRPFAFALVACAAPTVAACGGRVEGTIPSTGQPAFAVSGGESGSPRDNGASPATPLPSQAPVALPAGPPEIVETPDPDARAPILADSGAPGPSPPPAPPLDRATPVRDGDACMPWSAVSGETFVAASPADASLSVALSDLSGAVVGPWIGHATSPWGEWDLTVTFTADGRYSARAYDGTGNAAASPLAFYYGTDVGCDPLKEWHLSGVAADGRGLGEIDIPFSYGSDGCGLPSWQGELSQLVPGSKHNRLRFAFSTSDGYGPIQYDLWLACRPFDVDGGTP
jgi:hypothetical protein